jgi:hypothetical protein
LGVVLIYDVVQNLSWKVHSASTRQKKTYSFPILRPVTVFTKPCHCPALPWASWTQCTLSHSVCFRDIFAIFCHHRLHIPRNSWSQGFRLHLSPSPYLLYVPLVIFFATSLS